MQLIDGGLSQGAPSLIHPSDCSVVYSSSQIVRNTHSYEKRPLPPDKQQPSKDEENNASANGYVESAVATKIWGVESCGMIDSRSSDVRRIKWWAKSWLCEAGGFLNNHLNSSQNQEGKYNRDEMGWRHHDHNKVKMSVAPIH
jgi:hypothetical protein